MPDTKPLTIALLLPVSEVPAGRVVSKPTGTAPLTVLDELPVHGGPSVADRSVVYAGCRLLLSSRNVTVVPNDFVVKLLFSSWEDLAVFVTRHKIFSK